MDNEGLYSVVKEWEKSLQKAIGSEFCGSLATWPELWVTREIQLVMDSSNFSMYFSRGLFHGSTIASQLWASRENHFLTDSSPNSHTQLLYKISQKYREMIEQKYNQIWHDIKANIYIVVNHT